ncbi:MAG: hypothetical protein ACREBC_38635, partial [Pyrinomonadaceae bacterium]
DFESAVVKGLLNFAGTALRRDFSINFEDLRFEGEGGVHFSFVNIQNEARINLGVHLSEGSTLSFRSGNFHGGRISFTGLHMDGGRLDLRCAVMTRGSMEWSGSLLQNGTILIPEDDQIVSRLNIPANHADASGGVVVQTEPFG